MKESQRRFVLFIVIVASGSAMILFDVPLIAMIPLILGVGIVILMALGAITITDVRTVLEKAGFQNLKNSLHLNRSETKSQSGKIPPQGDKKKSSPTDGIKPGKNIDKKTGISAHLHSFITSIGSLGTVIRQRSKQGKKVEEINKLLDKTISEKVSKSALASAGNVGAPSLPSAAGGAGSLNQNEQDPFLSLSGDEFDMGLLDELDDQDMQSTGGTESPEGSPESPKMLNESESPLPAPEFSSETDNILKENAAGLEEFDGLEGADTIDQDFEDLENISLDDIDLDNETSTEQPEAISDSPASDDTSQPQQVAAAAPIEIKNDWISSDAPQEDEISTQSDMAAFAGGHGSDDDLLSSIASDVKHVKKESDLSLLRELKDFKAPADEIADELTKVYEKISSAPKQERKNPAPKER
jgi:hypothetical protein